jgi:LmbE family N-acetylglucosaminyl deacetylase
MAERLVDVLNEKQNVLHTFPVDTPHPNPDEDKLHEKALSAARHAQLVSPEDIDKLSARSHVSRGGQLAPYGDSLETSAETRSSLEQGVRDRAYFLWEEAGSPEGSNDEFWHLARDEHFRLRAYKLWEMEGYPEGHADRHWHWTRDFEDK